MTVLGVDYSDGRPGGAALAAAGMAFACRYLTWPGIRAAAALTATEVADLHGHGIAVVANFEKDQTRALGGRAAGLIDGQQALTALQALGFPSDRPVYFSVDFDAVAGQQPAIDAYLGGCAVALGSARVGVYAGIGPIGRCAANHSARWFWQTLAWSGGKVSPFAHLYQNQTGSTGAKPINGAAVDYDRALQLDYGQWAAQAAGGDVALNYRAQAWTTAGTDVLDAPGGKKLTTIKGAVTTLGETTDGHWRLVLVPGPAGPFHGTLGYVARIQLTPGPAVDAAFDEAVYALALARKAPPTPVALSSVLKPGLYIV